MSQFIVTLKLPRNRAHDPHNKVTGPCPLSGHECTDQTGEHHSVIVDATTSAAARAWFTDQGIHVTRIEVVTRVTVVPGLTVTDEQSHDPAKNYVPPWSKVSGSTWPVTEVSFSTMSASGNCAWRRTSGI